MRYTDNEHTKRIDTPPEIATGPNGAPGWVVLKTRFKNKYANAFGQVFRFRQRLNDAIDAGDTDNAKELGAQALAASEFAWTTYAYLVLDWNWIDIETGEPLPKPSGNNAVFREELYPFQTSWIAEQIQEIDQYRATEGNEQSGDGSKLG